MMTLMDQITFFRCGELVAPAGVPQQRGVYFFFSTAWNRIVYVGTANAGSLASRIARHQSLFRDGQRTMWRVPAGIDIYEFMAAAFEQVPRLQRDDVVYVPGVAPSDWHRFQAALAEHLGVAGSQAVGAYLRNLDVYCAVTNCALVAKQSERALQTALNNAYSLRYYKPAPQSWLGRVESVDTATVAWRIQGPTPSFRPNAVEARWFTAV
jgi:hypothetical protein